MANFFFSTLLGKSVLTGLLIGVLVVWWQIDRSNQREIGALTERVTTRDEAYGNVDKASEVRALAERRARGERLRGVLRDPYAED